jgi:hypothetical protein
MALSGPIPKGDDIMSRKILLSNLIIIASVFAAVSILSGFTFSRAIEEKGKNYIVDLHGEHWDVTQAESIGFDPERFRHGIGRFRLDL